MSESESAPVVRRRWRLRRRHTIGGALMLVLAMAGLLWIERREIANRFIHRQLTASGVTARYEVAQIGPRTQRLENVVIGDPGRPDLTADSIEVETAIGLTGPRVSLIRARGVRLYGRIEDGQLKLGEIDKLMPAPSGAPFRLPDVALDLDDTSMRLDTPAGQLGLSIRGKGKLSDGFAGKVATVSRTLRFGDCGAERVAALIDVGVTDRRPSLRGPLRAERLSCPGVRAAEPQAAVDATLTEALDGWFGNARLGLARLDAERGTATGLSGRISFAGDKALTKGTAELRAATAAFGGSRAGPTSIGGSYAVSPSNGGASFRGDIDARQVAFGSDLVRPATAALAGAEGTPVGPIAAALADATRRAARALDLRGSLALASAGGGAARLEALDAASASGARLRLAGSGLTYYATRRTAQLDGVLDLSGGGFPDTRIALRQAVPGGPLSGEARIAPMAAGGARLALAPVRFTEERGATRIETAALLSGPIGDGAVRDLLVPVSGRVGPNGLVFGERCTPVRFDALRLSGLELGPTRLPLCPSGGALIRLDRDRLAGGGSIAAPRLAGRLGGSPLSVNATRIRFDLARRDFDTAGVKVALGEHRLELAQLAGTFGSGGASGRFGGLSGELANVPLLVSQGQGQWRMRGSALALDGSVTVSDAADPARFHPLASKDFHLTLANNAIEAGGWLVHPETGVRVTQVSIDHSLGSGAGRAVLDVPGIAFTPHFQPERLTPLTLGVIALVDGSIQGRGEIRWNAEGVSSDGIFSIEGMNLAAPFGPVEKLSTTVRFTDLLGLVTAPGQIATVGLVQAGLNVYDGRVAYQLLPGQRVRVESGLWPFAGGELRLEETVLDFSQPSDKHLTFRVAGLDGARFIQQMEFENIAATGLFDGVVPMIFDERGGRVVGGHLEARPEGGTLSYIGELTDRDLGVYGKLAFDALKALSYERLVLDLDGALDGEFVTQIELDGIARDVVAAPPAGGDLRTMLARRALGQLAKIPFEFNITVRGPFRTLLATARSLEDPSLLIQSALPPELRDLPTTVQPQESEPVP